MAALFGKSRYSTVRAKKTDTDANGKKKDKIPQGTFDKCEGCGEVVYANDFENNLNVCPRCAHHRPLTAERRVRTLTDEFKEIDAALKSANPLSFTGKVSYDETLAKYRESTGMNEAVMCGVGRMDKRVFALGVMDFRFLGASMGSAVGEKITRLTELATREKLPLVIVTASSGARMHEGMLSLMQMAKTSGALERHAEAGLPYIVVMTHPTTAGVSASFATLGDLILAEPRAMIGFAGPRVIKDTTQATLPDGFQTSEFLLKKGLIDRVVHRKDLRRELGLCMEYLSGACDSEKSVNSIVESEAEKPK